MAAWLLWPKRSVASVVASSGYADPKGVPLAGAPLQADLDLSRGQPVRVSQRIHSTRMIKTA